MTVVYDHLISLGEVKCDIAGMQKIISEPLFDDVLLVARAHDEFVETIVRIALHDMPEDRHATDFNHGLGLVLGFLTDACTVSAGEKDDFH